MLPADSPLGRITVDEVFLDYDGPKLFSALNATGQRFVAVAVEEDEESTTFLYVPVTEDRYGVLRSGVSPFGYAFREPEGVIYQVKSHYAQGKHDVSVIDDVPEDWLPEPGAVLTFPTVTQKPFVPEELGTRAKSQTRSLFALELDRPDLFRTEYPLRDLRDLIDDLQEAVHAMAAESEDRATSTGAIPEYIIRDSELSLVELQAASFVMVMAPTLGDRIVEMPLATSATQRLVSVISAAETENGFRTAVAGLQKRAFSKVRNLFQDLVDTETSLRAYLAQPNGELETAVLGWERATWGLGILSEVSTTSREVYVASGVLIGANVRTRAFELRDEQTDDKYSGRVDKAALKQLDGLQLGENFRYSARILVEENYGSASGEPRVIHRLEMIRRVVSGGPEWGSSSELGPF